MRKIGINLAGLALGLSITLFSVPMFGMAEESELLSVTEETGQPSSLEIKTNGSLDRGEKAVHAEAYVTVQKEQRELLENKEIEKKDNVKAQVDPEIIKPVQKEGNQKQEWKQANADTALTKTQSSKKHELSTDASSKTMANDQEQNVRTKSDQQSAKETTNPLIKVEVKHAPVIGDVKVSAVTPSENKNRHLIEADTKNTPILGDVHAGVLDHHTAKEPTGSERTDEGAIEVNTEDTPVLEDVHVGVLDDHLINNGLGSAQSSEAILDATLEELPILESIHLGVLEHKSQTNDEGATGQDSIAKLTIENGVLGELDFAILEKEWFVPVDSLPETDTPVANVPGSTGNTDVMAPQPTEEEEEASDDSIKNPDGSPEAPGSGKNPDHNVPEGEDVSGNQEDNRGNLSGVNSNPNSGKNGSQLDIGSNMISVKLNKRNDPPLSSGPTLKKGKQAIKDKPQSSMVNKLMDVVDWTLESLKAHASTVENGSSANRVNTAEQEQMTTQEARLPKTGGFLDGYLLFLLALSLISGGYFIYRKNKRDGVFK